MPSAAVPAIVAIDGGRLENKPGEMTSDDDIPADVRQFILGAIDSVPHLEALLLFWERVPDQWTEQQMSRTLFIDADTTSRIIRTLLRRGWIKAGASADTFQFDHSWDPSGAFMQKLAYTYRTRLVRVATLIHANASSAVRDFARAFDLKKD